MEYYLMMNSYLGEEEETVLGLFCTWPTKLSGVSQNHGKSSCDSNCC